MGSLPFVTFFWVLPFLFRVRFFCSWITCHVGLTVLRYCFGFPGCLPVRSLFVCRVGALRLTGGCVRVGSIGFQVTWMPSFVFTFLSGLRLVPPLPQCFTCYHWCHLRSAVGAIFILDFRYVTCVTVAVTGLFTLPASCRFSLRRSAFTVLPLRFGWVGYALPGLPVPLRVRCANVATFVWCSAVLRVSLRVRYLLLRCSLLLGAFLRCFLICDSAFFFDSGSDLVGCLLTVVLLGLRCLFYLRCSRYCGFRWFRVSAYPAGLRYVLRVISVTGVDGAFIGAQRAFCCAGCLRYSGFALYACR